MIYNNNWNDIALFIFNSKYHIIHILTFFFTHYGRSRRAGVGKVAPPPKKKKKKKKKREKKKETHIITHKRKSTAHRLINSSNTSLSLRPADAKFLGTHMVGSGSHAFPANAWEFTQNMANITLIVTADECTPVSQTLIGRFYGGIIILFLYSLEHLTFIFMF